MRSWVLSAYVESMHFAAWVWGGGGGDYAFYNLKCMAWFQEGCLGFRVWWSAYAFCCVGSGGPDYAFYNSAQHQIADQVQLGVGQFMIRAWAFRWHNIPRHASQDGNSPSCSRR